MGFHFVLPLKRPARKSNTSFLWKVSGFVDCLPQQEGQIESFAKKYGFPTNLLYIYIFFFSFPGTEQYKNIASSLKPDAHTGSIWAKKGK